MSARITCFALAPRRYFRSLTTLTSSIREMSIFTQCLNPLTGTASWEEKDQNYDYHQEVARSAFADMLHDHERNEKYYIALKAAIDKKLRNGEEANVLDIGTGTGLLSMMAAKCGADSITACEAFKPMAKCAIKILEENDYSDRIKLVFKRSTKMTVGKDCDMAKKANILVTEVFDTELIGEGALSTFRHAHECLLEENSIVVPSAGTIWAQVVDSQTVSLWNRIKPIRDAESQSVLIDPPLDVQLCSGAAAVHDMQLTRLPHHLFTPLMRPQQIFRFDWSGKKPLIFKEKALMTDEAIASGNANVIFMWWHLNMDEYGDVILSCAPVWEHPDAKEPKLANFPMEKIADTIPWRDHWMQAVYYLPVELPITAGSIISLVGYHDEYSFWFQVDNKYVDEAPNCERPVCNCCIHVAYSRTRIGQLNDVKRNDKYIKALKGKITKDSVCLCLSDGSLLSLASAKLGAKLIYVLETNYLSKKTTEMFIKANGLTEKVRIIDSLEKLPEADEIDLIFGEPYFISSIVPWENLRFWYTIARYPRNIQRIPIAATIKGVAVEFKDLHKIRAPLGKCEGFDLTSFDKLVQASSEKSDNPVEVHPLWEYPCTALSLPFDVITLDLTANVMDQKRITLSDTIHILNSGSCNGIALWIDWHLNKDITVTSGPIEEIVPGFRISWDPYTRQGVHLFKNILNVTNESHVSWSFNFVPQHGTMEFEFNILLSKN
ncbi:protein arginine N-methyltransferase 7 [Prorops nasuta]|uniref:protein arginine N-methyltransferase 7 n=1 Tax=Prorops nasuta TaxID=863751 RepID=UPI0034CDEBFC